jgi:hypothetical protein
MMDTTPRVCDFCEDSYTPRHPVQRFCSTDCRYRHARQLRHEQRVAERLAREGPGVTPSEAPVEAH